MSRGIKPAGKMYKIIAEIVVNMNIVVSNNISSKLKNSTSEIDYYSYTKRCVALKRSAKFRNLMLNKVTSNPKKLFLIDSLGALLTAFLLGVVLIRFEVVFGMPKTILYYLSLIALILSIYSICCHFLLNRNWRLYLKGIIIANLAYCLITIGLIIYFYQKLTFIGLFYFIGEILIIITLVTVELKTLSKLIVQYVLDFN